MELVTIPGNHETDNLSKIAYSPGERTWVRDMAAYITRGGNGPGAAGADSLATDQSKLSYSFDFKDAHFVTLNTDPVGKDWHVPDHWVATDLAAARSRGVKHIFVIGHQPTGKTWIVIAGNGGTPIDATADPTIVPTGTYFGFTLVTVTNSGRVFSKSYGRDVPAAGYATAPTTPTTLRDSVEITWK